MTVVLVVATHPDDEVLGCGGVIARHSNEGDQVHVLVVTRGVPEIFPPEEVEGTRLELEQAHRLLGVSGTHFLDFPAPKLDAVPGHELADGIKGAIDRLGPQLVYCPYGGDIHADHRAVYQAVLVAGRPIDGCSVEKIMCYETLSETEWASPQGGNGFTPLVFVDISSQLEQKLRAMACYRSQLRESPHPRSLEAIEALARFRGSSSGLDAAEAFVLIREIIT